ncbi:type II toxin-antitoxin system Phd/YefM family antitoxin [Porticoccaceae bacterium]|nr:type II toxin-antitoxin system Phd/YefM family antitoxin [Porticoccaceae bacterium]
MVNNKVVRAVSRSGQSVAAISSFGRVYHWRSHELIADVGIELSEIIDGVSSELGSTFTDAEGEFSLGSHEPVVITGKRGNAVLLAEDDWNAINETLHLLAVPGMRESIIEGMQESIDSAATELNW